MVFRSGRWRGQRVGGFVRHRPAGARRIQGSRLPPSASAQASRKSDRPNTASGAVAARSRRGAGEWPRWWPRCAAGAWASPMLKRSGRFRASRSAAWPECASATWRAMRACTPANPIVSVFVGALKARTQQSLGSLPAGIECPLQLRDRGRAHQAAWLGGQRLANRQRSRSLPASSSAVGLTGRGSEPEGSCTRRCSGGLANSRSMRPVGQLPGAKGDASMRDGRRTCKREKCRYGANTCVRPASPWG